MSINRIIEVEKLRQEQRLIYNMDTTWDIDNLKTKKEIAEICGLSVGRITVYCSDKYRKSYGLKYLYDKFQLGRDYIQVPTPKEQGGVGFKLMFKPHQVLKSLEVQPRELKGIRCE